MSSTIEKTALTGEQLEQYLDQVQHALTKQIDADLDQELKVETLKALLKNNIYIAHNLNVVARLFRLWVEAKEYSVALKVITKDGPNALKKSPKEDWVDGELCLIYWQLEVIEQADFSNKSARIDLILQQAEDLLLSQSRTIQWKEAWNHLHQHALKMQNFQKMRACIKALHEIENSIEERAEFRAWDQALYALRTANTFKKQGDKKQASFYAEIACNAMSQHQSNQHIDYFDWLNFGESIVIHQPNLLTTVVTQIEKLKPHNFSIARNRDIAVQIIRIEAKAYYAQGKMTQAINKTLEGRFRLCGDEDDAISNQLIEWMLEDNRELEAAQYAFESEFSEREISSQTARELALKKFDSNSQAPEQVYWLGIIALTVMKPDGKSLFENQQLKEEYYQYLISTIRKIDPQHFVIDLIEGEKKAAQFDYAGALPHLEKAMHTKALANWSLLLALLVSRVMVYGVNEAKKMPIPQCFSGLWCYTLGSQLHEKLKTALPPQQQFDDVYLDNLMAHFYQQGLSNFENFFNTGKGLYRDGDIHVYSMLCQQLATYYRKNLKQFDLAIAIHQKGFDASPFAEHLDGIMKCYRDADQIELFVQAAENLWNYAQSFAYAKHSPCHYFGWVANFLYRLERDTEIAIWLERLELAWRDQTTDFKAKPNNYESYLITMVTILSNLVYSQREDVLLRLSPIQRDCLLLNNHFIQLKIAFIYEQTDQASLAMELYQKVIDSEDADLEQIQYALDAIKRCQQETLKEQSWWKFWA